MPDNASVFEHPAFANHESVHFFSDPESGLRAIIAIHSRARGPAAGGCRMWPYANSQEALRDVLRLSEGMSYKNAVADLDLGGGKAVIIGDPKTAKTPALMQAFGRAIESLHGAYYTAEDVGISPSDMAQVRTKTRFVAGLDQGASASGDPSPVTARGVYLGIRSCLELVFGSSDPKGRHVIIQGVGHVGAYLAQYLAQAGARLTIADIDLARAQQVAGQCGAQIAELDAIYDMEADVFSPNALGAIINDGTIARFRVPIIAGGANNQLAVPALGDALMARKITYAPDYVINGGGIINVAAEISGDYRTQWVEEKLLRLNQRLQEILVQSRQEGRPANIVADLLARRIIAEAASRKGAAA